MVCLTGLRNWLWVLLKWDKIIFVTFTTCFKPRIIAHSSSNDFLLLLIRVTEASIPVSWRQLNSTVSFTFKFLRKTIKYAIPGRGIFDETLVFALVLVIHDIKKLDSRNLTNLLFQKVSCLVNLLCFVMVAFWPYSSTRCCYGLLTNL